MIRNNENQLGTSGISVDGNNDESKKNNTGIADASRSVIAILVVMTLMISIIGTWTILNQMSSIKTTTPSAESNSGKVQLTIVAPDNNPESNRASSSDSTGRVSLDIV